MRFVSLQNNLRVGDDRRNFGDEVPEARDWPTLPSLVATGVIGLVAEGDTPIPSGDVDVADAYQRSLIAARHEGARDAEHVQTAQTAPESADEDPAEGGVPEDAVQALYDHLNSEEVIDLMLSERLHPSLVLDLEDDREKGPRKGVVKAAQELIEDEEERREAEAEAEAQAQAQAEQDENEDDENEEDEEAEE